MAVFSPVRRKRRRRTSVLSIPRGESTDFAGIVTDNVAGMLFAILVG